MITRAGQGPVRALGKAAGDQAGCRLSGISLNVRVEQNGAETKVVGEILHS